MQPRPRPPGSRASGRSSSTARRFTQATWLAAKTESIGIGTGITWAFTRSPFLLAVSALDIDEMSGGRFRLGLGAGVKRLNERWHGAEYGRPAPHLRETVEATRLIMESANAGAPIRYEGTYHDIDIKGWTRPHPAFREKVPIYVAAVGEGMARMAGDVADGVLGHLICSPRWLEEVMIPNFEKGLSRSGRERSSFDFIPGMCVAIAEDDSEVEAAYDAARKTLAFYATVRTYAPVFEIDGFGSEAEAVGNAFRAGDLAGVAAAVTDEMVDTYCAVGTIDRVREKVGEVAASATRSPSARRPTSSPRRSASTSAECSTPSARRTADQAPRRPKSPSKRTLRV